MTTVFTVLQVGTTPTAIWRVVKPDGSSTPSPGSVLNNKKPQFPPGGELRLKLRIDRSPGPFPSTGAPLLTNQALGNVDFNLAEIGLMPLQ